MRTDSIKVERDLEGHVTTVSVAAQPEQTVVARAPTTQLLAELGQFRQAVRR